LFAGRYLPVVACLGGVLTVQPKNYFPSMHDVVRLQPVVADMQMQQGFICCHPLNNKEKRVAEMPLHFAVKVGTAAERVGWWYSVNRGKLQVRQHVTYLLSFFNKEETLVVAERHLR
jgi:hypothetical protein